MRVRVPQSAGEATPAGGYRPASRRRRRPGTRPGRTRGLAPCELVDRRGKRLSALPRDGLAERVVARDRAQPHRLVSRAEHIQPRDRKAGAAHCEVPPHPPVIRQREQVIGQKAEHVFVVGFAAELQIGERFVRDRYADRAERGELRIERVGARDAQQPRAGLAGVLRDALEAVGKAGATAASC